MDGKLGIGNFRENWILSFHVEADWLKKGNDVLIKIKSLGLQRIQIKMEKIKIDCRNSG